MKKTTEERFWEKVEVTESCWLWTAGITHNGYGKFGERGKTLRAHRVAYERYIGKIPDGFILDHLCRVRRCVNPNHLEAITHKENTIRGESNNQYKGKTHCIRGHEFTEENTRLRKFKNKTTGEVTSKRSCKACQDHYNNNRKFKEVQTIELEVDEVDDD